MIVKNGPELIRSRVAEHLGVRLTPGQVSQQHAKSYGPVPPGPPWYESLSVWIAGGALAIALLLAWLPRSRGEACVAGRGCVGRARKS